MSAFLRVRVRFYSMPTVKLRSSVGEGQEDSGELKGFKAHCAPTQNSHSEPPPLLMYAHSKKRKHLTPKIISSSKYYFLS
jgi:hypothetical protein